MNLKTLIEQSKIKTNIPVNANSLDVTDMSYDSRLVKNGDLFFAMKGVHVDGHNFLNDVQKKGAIAAVVEHHVETSLPTILVPSVAEAMSSLANEFFGRPSQRIPVIGITGTNGKTTITYLLEKMLGSLNKKCGVMGTITYRFGSEETPAPNTTPMSLDVHRFIAKAIEKKVDAVVMEVSSHALEQFRVNTVHFSVGVFTNLTQDHLDFHKDMESYFNAKARLFRDFREIKSAINIDDPYGERMVKEFKNAMTFGFDLSAHVRAEKAVSDLSGIHFDLFIGSEKFPMSTNLVGRHNISNILAACGALLNMGISAKDVAKAAQQNFSVPGRLERVEAGQDFVVVVDYAHSEDALVQVLRTLRDTKPHKLFCIFGAGGDRDKTKRPKMGKAATRLADHVIVTSDNPRSEVPAAIIKDIEAGIQEIGQKNYEVQEDRTDAIFSAIRQAQKNDIVLIAGKGHETYQIYGTEKRHFSDQETALAALRERFKGSK